MRLLLVIFFAVAFPPGAVLAQSTCDESALKQAAADVRDAQSKLLAVKVADWGMDSTVPPSLQTLIRDFKDVLTKASDLSLHCGPKSDLSPRALEQSLSKLLGANLPTQSNAIQMSAEPAKEEVDQIYGASPRVSVQASKEFPKLRFVEITFGIDCGDDAILLAYDLSQGRAKRVLRWQSGDYNKVSDAFGDYFRFFVVPMRSNSGWGVITFHGTPWCTSRWSAFSLDLIVPDGDSAAQSLSHIRASYVRDEDPILKQVRNGIELRVMAGSLDVDIMTRPAIFRYEVVGKSLRRAQPIAMNGRDFVDEWLASDWNDAKRWASSDHLEPLHDIHGEMESTWKSTSSSRPLYHFGPVRACSQASKQFQVELDRDPGSPSYFRIGQGQNTFTMISVNKHADPACNGPDLMRKK